jgi:hypothetical protein
MHDPEPLMFATFVANIQQKLQPQADSKERFV